MNLIHISLVFLKNGAHNANNITNKSYLINVREYRRANHKWTIQRKSRETGNIRYTRRRKTKQKHNTICVEHHYEQSNTNNVN